MTDQGTAAAGLPSAAQPLFILAMDHRDSFGKTLFGVTGTPSAEQLTSMRDAKALIFAAARELAGSDLRGGRLGILVDERLGAEVARQAKAAGFVLAMPVEASGADRFTFEYGDDFAQHIEAFDPDWIKVLVHFNPADPAELREDQTRTLRRLHDWVSGSGRRWMLELLVPPSRAQLAAHEDQARYDTDERPALTAEVIGALSAAGVRPDLWKLEGYQTTGGAQLVLGAVTAAGSPVSPCIVLGRNAPQRQVDHWLDVAAPLPGFAGFAIGRSIWDEPVADYVAGRADRDRTQARITERYRHFVTTYLGAAGPREGGRTGADWTRAEQPSYGGQRLTPDTEAEIRRACIGADPHGTMLPAWMTLALLAEVDALRAGN